MSNQQLNLNPWTKIWFSPREAIREIVQTNKNYGLIRLFFIYGFVLALNFADSMSLGTSYSAAAILIAGAILAIPLGYITLSISTILFYWIGKGLKKGNGADYQSVRASIVWSNVPSIVTIITWFALVAYFGSNAFTKNFADQELSRFAIALTQSLGFIQLIVGIWGLVIFIRAYSEIQQFSIWMALLNLIIVTIVWLLILIACVLVTYVLLKSSAVAMLIR